jgi:hypothetical protein
MPFRIGSEVLFQPACDERVQLATVGSTHFLVERAPEKRVCEIVHDVRPLFDLGQDADVKQLIRCGDKGRRLDGARVA